MGSAPLVLPPYGLHGGWRVRGTNSYQPMMASVIIPTLTTKLKNKEPDRNENVTYYDRWFVIQAVDDDKPLSKISPFAIDKALRCAVETVKSIRCLRSGDLLVEVGFSKSFTQQDKQSGLSQPALTAFAKASSQVAQEVHPCLVDRSHGLNCDRHKQVGLAKYSIFACLPVCCRLCCCARGLRRCGNVRRR